MKKVSELCRVFFSFFDHCSLFILVVDGKNCNFIDCDKHFLEHFLSFPKCFAIEIQIQENDATLYMFDVWMFENKVSIF